MPNRSLLASGPREPRVRLLPVKIRNAIKMLVWDDVDIVDASKAVGYAPDTLRRYLTDRPSAFALFRSERKAYLAVANAANPRHLVQIRNESGNDMAKNQAIRQLEEMDPDQRVASAAPNAGVVIRIISVQRGDTPPTIEVTPVPTEPAEPELREPAEPPEPPMPRFRWPRDYNPK
jgi:hypothetical protein